MSLAEYQAMIGRVVLGRYRVVRLLAIGGMGVIYLARSEGAAGFIRPVTVKRILPAKGSAESIVKGFAREARILSNLRHPGIVGIIDFREEEGAYLMVLDYVHGYDLGKWYRFVQTTRGRFPVDLGVHVVLSMLDALHYAHTLTGPDGKPLDIVHRDVSPSNLLVDIDGHLKLTDFGIARMQASAEEWRTEEGKIRGKFHYVAPELFGRAEPTAASDVFSAGVVLHELLSGANEFRAEDFQTTVGRVLGHQLSSLDRVRPDVSPDLAAVVARATAKHIDDRFATAREFGDALRAVRHESGEDVAAEFKTTVAHDFVDPRLPMMFGIEALRVLEQSWKDPPSPPAAAPARPRRSDPTERPADPPTDVMSLPARSNPPGAPTPAVVAVPTAPTADAPLAADAPPAPALADRSQTRGTSVLRVRRARWLALSALLVSAGGIVAALVLARAQPPAPRFVLVQEGEVVGEGGSIRAPQAPETSTTGRGVSSAAGVTPTAAPVEPHTAAPRPAPPEQALTRAFARQERRVERCFVEHATDTERAAQIAVRFRVDATGRVERAELIPAVLETSPLGVCLLEAARETKFDPQAKPMTFRIPVTVRRGS